MEDKKSDSQPEFVVIVAEGCPGCEHLKKALNPNSRIRFLDITKDAEAVQIAQELNIMAVPTFVAINRDLGELCSLDRDFKPVKCVKRIQKPNKAQ